jgi:hypothetical protein
MTNDDLNAYEKLAATQFVDPSASEEALEITGLEILMFVSAKVALPILTGFVGRALYDKWKNPVKPVTKEDLDGLRKELLNAAIASEPVVDEETILIDAARVLAAEGVADKRAREIAKAILAAARDGGKR